MTLLSDMRIFVVDCETDNKDAAQAAPVEIAALELVVRDGQLRRRALSSTLVNPGRAIDVRAMAVHHITDAMVKNAPSIDEAFGWLDSHVPWDALVVAHHAEYDLAVLTVLKERRWLCTERLAHHLYPDAPAFKNDVLRYWLGLKCDTSGLPSHRAPTDVVVTGALLAKEISGYSTLIPGELGVDVEVDALCEFAAKPYLWQRMPFGKHRDSLISEVPQSYFTWAFDNISDLSDDLRHTFETELKRRKGAAA